MSTDNPTDEELATSIRLTMIPKLDAIAQVLDSAYRSGLRVHFSLALDPASGRHQPQLHITKPL